MADAARQKIALIERRCLAAIGQAIGARRRRARRIGICLALLERCGRLIARLRIGRHHPFSIGRQSFARPAAIILRLIISDMNRRFIICRCFAEGLVPGPAGLFRPAHFKNLTAALALGFCLRAGRAHKGAELADGDFGRIDLERADRQHGLRKGGRRWSEKQSKRESKSCHGAES